MALAQKHPDRQVVFFAVGFETTAPANAMAVVQAAKLGLKNFSMLVSHVLVPPAIRAVLGSPANRVQGFLAAGHVCTITGLDEYRPIAETYRVPIVVTGFEPLDILQGVLMCVEQLEAGRHEVENQYARSVRPEGNRVALRQMAEVFQTVPRKWRGIGEIPAERTGLARNVRQVRRRAAFRRRRQSRPKSRPSALPAKSCKATRSRTIVRLSASIARPSGRWALRWFPPKGPVRRIIAIGRRSLKNE